jgi:hypothetical protein
MAKEQEKSATPILPPEQPVMTYGQLLEGQSLLRKFLKKIEIRVKREKVVTSYIWEFPDEVVAKTFAEQMKLSFEGSLNPEGEKK